MLLWLLIHFVMYYPAQTSCHKIKQAPLQLGYQTSHTLYTMKQAFLEQYFLEKLVVTRSFQNHTQPVFHSRNSSVGRKLNPHLCPRSALLSKCCFVFSLSLEMYTDATLQAVQPEHKGIIDICLQMHWTFIHTLNGMQLLATPNYRRVLAGKHNSSIDATIDLPKSQINSNDKFTMHADIKLLILSGQLVYALKK